MLKKASVVVLVVLGLALAACSSPQAAQVNPGSGSGSNQAGQGSNSGSNNAGQANNANAASRPISLEEKLAVGTLDLEATDQAVTAAQAKVLLPLWQQVKTQSAQFNFSLNGSNPSSSGSNSSTPGSGSSSSGTYSPANEMTAVLTQIQQAMTADQINAIDAMNLTATDVQSELDELGVPTPTAFPTLSADQRATRTAQRQTQAANGGGSGGGGGFGGFQGTPSPNGTPGFRGDFRMDPVLVDAVINLLTQRAG